MAKDTQEGLIKELKKRNSIINKKVTDIDIQVEMERSGTTVTGPNMVNYV